MRPPSFLRGSADNNGNDLYLVIVLHMVTGRELHPSRVSPNMVIIPSISKPRLRLWQIYRASFTYGLYSRTFPRHPAQALKFLTGAHPVQFFFPSSHPNYCTVLANLVHTHVSNSFTPRRDPRSILETHCRGRPRSSAIGR